MSASAHVRGTAATVVGDTVAVLGFAALTAAGSRVTVELPGIPVPLTLG